jgi:NOL1/NOP2/fmu family ribosome biogenesis protein
MDPLSNPKKKKILVQLNDQYGITKLPYLLLQFGKEKTRLYSGSLSKQDLINIDRQARVETLGLYAINNQQDQIRLTIEGVQLFKDQITKNILELNKEQADQWLRGIDLDIKSDSNFKVLKYKKDFIGCGKSTGERITNFVPKERRIKN